MTGPICAGCRQAPATRELLQKANRQPFPAPQLVCEQGAKAYGYHDTRAIPVLAVTTATPASQVVPGVAVDALADRPRRTVLPAPTTPGRRSARPQTAKAG